MAMAAGSIQAAWVPSRHRRRQAPVARALGLLAAAAVLALAARTLPVANGPAALTAAVALLPPATVAAASGCTPTTAGVIGAGNRINVTAELSGPAGVQDLPVTLDTGAQQTVIPASVLQALGYRPLPGTITVQGVTGAVDAQRYRVAAPAISAGAGWLPLGSGTLIVLGIPASAGDASALIGLDAIKGLDLQISGDRWQLTGTCPTHPA